MNAQGESTFEFAVLLPRKNSKEEIFPQKKFVSGVELGVVSEREGIEWRRILTVSVSIGDGKGTKLNVEAKRVKQLYRGE